MKKLIKIFLVILFALVALGCSNKSMNYIISNKPSVTGIVEEVYGDYFIMYSETAEGYPNGSRWSVSLNAENKDSYTDVVEGDEVVMYYDGMAMETDPLQVSKVYAITLKTPASQTTLIANPWTNWDSIEEAESVIGFSFGLLEVIADSYNAVSIRTLNNELIEVVYRDGDFEICIRKQKGEGQDISGDYNKYETCTETNHNGGTITNYHNSNNNAVKQLISYKGYSWSLVAPNGYWGDSNWDFIGGIFL